MLNVRIAYSETSIQTVYHYEKALKASDIAGMARLNKCSSLVEFVDFSDLSRATVGCLQVFPNK